MANRCPQCGSRTLFAGVLRFAPRCTACGLDFDQFNVGDGASAFGTLLVGAVVVIGAVWMQIVWAPSMWVQIAVWFPIATLLTVWFIRQAKAKLLRNEYHHKAHEGRLVK